MGIHATQHRVPNAIDKELVVIERLSKKSKNSKFSNFVCNEINNLQASNSQLLSFSTTSKSYLVLAILQL